MNPLFRTARLVYRAACTPWGQDILAFLAMLFAIAGMTVLLTLSCVALHGEEVCFN